MKSRLEDLGRLYEKLDLMVEDTLFEYLWDEELFVRRYLNNEINIRDHYDHLSQLKNQLFICWSIAKGDEDD